MQPQGESPADGPWEVAPGHGWAEGTGSAESWYPHLPFHVWSPHPSCTALLSFPPFPASHPLQPLLLNSPPSSLTFHSPAHPAGPFMQTLHQPSHFLLSPVRLSTPSATSQLCPPKLDPSSSSGPIVPLAESHGCSAPQGGSHLSWDDLIPANSTGITPHPAPSCLCGLWASLKCLCGQWRSRIQGQIPPGPLSDGGDRVGLSPES